MLKEFKEFAVRGNVVDLAVGIIVGGAFGKIVSSFVNDLLMPPLGLLAGKMDFTNLFINLGDIKYTSLDAAKKAGAPTLNYGMFINTTVDFILMAFAVFLLVKWINKLRGPAPVPAPAPPATKDCPYCCSAIPLQAKKCPNCTSELS